MRLIITSKTLVEQLQNLKLEVAAKPNPVLAIIEEILFGLPTDKNESTTDKNDSKANRARVKSALSRLKLLKNSKLVKKVKRLVFNTKYLRHLRNFFSCSSCTNNFVSIRRILLKLLKKNPEEDHAIYLLCNSNSFFNNKKFNYAHKTIGYYR